MGASARTAASAVVLALAVTATAACGSDNKKDSGSSGSGGGRFTVGIKFDEPGIGQKTPQGYAGFDVDVANYVAGSSATSPTRSSGRRRRAPAPRERALAR